MPHWLHFCFLTESSAWRIPSLFGILIIVTWRFYPWSFCLAKMCLHCHSTHCMTSNISSATICRIRNAKIGQIAGHISFCTCSTGKKSFARSVEKIRKIASHAFPFSHCSMMLLCQLFWHSWISVWKHFWLTDKTYVPHCLQTPIWKICCCCEKGWLHHSLAMGSSAVFFFWHHLCFCCLMCGSPSNLLCSCQSSLMEKTQMTHCRHNWWSVHSVGLLIIAASLEPVASCWIITTHQTNVQMAVSKLPLKKQFRQSNNHLSTDCSHFNGNGMSHATKHIFNWCCPSTPVHTLSQLSARDTVQKVNGKMRTKQHRWSMLMHHSASATMNHED